MLYPQSGPFRQCIDLSGFWTFRVDQEQIGEANGWATGFDGGRPIAVPASWNDQFDDWRDYLGPAWYQLRFDRPWGWEQSRVYLRFNSVNYLAEVWLNGVRLGQHEGGHLPFIFDVSQQILPADNLLVVRVDGELAPDRVPPGNIPYDPADSLPLRSFPPSSFDFFPFCGIQRPVLLYATPQSAIDDLTVVTDIEGSSGVVRVDMRYAGDAPTSARLTLRGHGAAVAAEVPLSGQQGAAELRVAAAALWGPGSPNLYELTAELLRDGVVVDSYALSVGIRTIAVAGDQLLLNREPITLQGFGRHEDFPVVGRGLLPALIIKDYALMEWVGANSFRTAHYPYSEQMMALADQLGILVIDETPAVGLFFREEGLARRLELCRQYTEELIARDKNHPCVIMWSLANEPLSYRPAAKDFLHNLYDLAKSLDPSRPATIVSMVGLKEEAFEFCDVVCLNRYNGWYTDSGRIEEGCAKLADELDALHERYPKPLLLAEFGADTVPGHHAQPSEMFSEEYQAELLAAYITMLRSKPYVVGHHVWNMCDFKTAQAIVRVGGLNLKGVFTRDRRPKLAAHRLRQLWRGSA